MVAYLLFYWWRIYLRPAADDRLDAAIVDAAASGRFSLLALVGHVAVRWLGLVLPITAAFGVIMCERLRGGELSRAGRAGLTVCGVCFAGTAVFAAGMFVWSYFKMRSLL